MRLSVLYLAVLVAVVSSQGGRKKSTMLLGADNVDKDAVDRLSGNKVEVASHKNFREIKKLAQDDRVKIRQMQSRVRQLKTEMSNKDKSKSQKKALKKEFRQLKQTLHTKKAELSGLKSEMKIKKGEMKGKPFRGSGNGQKKGSKDDEPKDVLFLEEQKELSLLQTTTAKPTDKPAPQATTVAALLELNKKVARRKSQRKNERKNNKKNRNKNKDMLNMMQSDQPQLPLRQRLGRRTPCTTDADCTVSGTKCMQNRKGHKHCKSPHGKNKPAGKKCHRSEQCAAGLQCFVTLTSEQQHHKKHPRRGKGTCADPATTDASKGKFIPFVAKVEQ